MESSAPSVAGGRRSHFSRVRHAPVVPILILVAVALAGILADLLAVHDPANGDLRDFLLPPAWVPGGDQRFLLGTDQLGRDIVARLLFGARVCLIVVLLSVGLGGVVGSLLGLLAGHFGGWLDEIMMRAVDVQMSVPALLVTLVLVIVFGSSFELLILILALWLWPTYARLVRAETLRIRTMDYVALARVAGASTWRIMFVHELPGVVNSIIVIATLQTGWVILLEGSLSFLGVGVPPPNPTWGSMIADGRGLISIAWWVSLFPGFVMLLVVLSLNLLGDWLRDVLDPRKVII